MKKIRVVQFGTWKYTHSAHTIGAHSGARPKIESQHRSWTEMDDSRAIFEYLSSGRISFKKIHQ